MICIRDVPVDPLIQFLITGIYTIKFFAYLLQYIFYLAVTNKLLFLVSSKCTLLLAGGYIIRAHYIELVLQRLLNVIYIEQLGSLANMSALEHSTVWLELRF